MELESSMIGTYHSQKWERHKWLDVKDKSYHIGVGITV
jgi:hypothetical protein